MHESDTTFGFDIVRPPLCASSDLLREACADSIVLLRNQTTKASNQTKLLPLDAKTKKIAVIGPNVVNTVISGGGSATLRPTYVVSPLKGIEDAAARIGAEVKYTVGVNDTDRQLSTIDPYLIDPLQLPKDAIKKLFGAYFDYTAGKSGCSYSQSLIQNILDRELEHRDPGA